MTSRKFLETVLEIVTQLKDEKNNLERKYDRLQKEVERLNLLTQQQGMEIKNVKKTATTTMTTSQNNAEYMKKLAAKLLYETKDLETKVDNTFATIENKLAVLEAKSNMNSIGNVREDIKELMLSINEIRNIVYINMKTFEENMKNITAKLENYDLQLKLIEVMNYLYRTGPSKERIAEGLEKLQVLAQKLKSVGLWDEEKEQSITNFLEDMSNTWDYYGYGDIAEMFRSKIKL